MTGWTKDASKAGRWKAPIPAGFNSSSIGGRMQMWRGDTRLTLARSPTLTYVHANSTFITFKGTDIASTYHDFANVHLVLYESWTASMHMLSHVDAANHKAYLASTYDSQWANQAAGARYYVENALEHLDQDDEYYVDHLSGSIFLQASTDPSTGPAIHLAGPVELLVLSGTPGTPLQGTSFSNVAFAHNVRTPQPLRGAPLGLPTAAALTVTCLLFRQGVEDLVTGGGSGQSGDFMRAAMVHITHARGISFDQCEFRASGGYAWWAEEGAYDCSLTRTTRPFLPFCLPRHDGTTGCPSLTIRWLACAGSTLTDLGSGAVRLGRGHAVDNTAKPECEGHTIADNIVRGPANRSRLESGG